MNIHDEKGNFTDKAADFCFSIADHIGECFDEGLKQGFTPDEICFLIFQESNEWALKTWRQIKKKIVY